MTSVSELTEKLIVDDEQIDNYFAQRGTDEHRKIKAPTNYFEDVVTYFSTEINGGMSLPFIKAEDKFRIRMGELTIVSGYSGHGKTMWLSYVMLHLLKSEKALIASFEMLPKATLGRMLLQTNSPDPTEDRIRDFVNNLDNKLYLYDAEGETSVDKCLSVIYYGAEQLGIKLFVLDSLMKVGINEDDYNGQKKFCNQLAVAARDLGVHIFLVAHSRKTSDEHETPNKFDVMGSSNITNLADNSISVFRNKKKELDMIKPDADMEELVKKFDCTVYINKQRHGNGYEGKMGFYFDTRTFRYGERPFNSKSVY